MSTTEHICNGEDDGYHRTDVSKISLAFHTTSQSKLYAYEFWQTILSKQLLNEQRNRSVTGYYLFIVDLIHMFLVFHFTDTASLADNHKPYNINESIKNSEVCLRDLQENFFVGSKLEPLKAKEPISKRVFQENKARQIFRKNRYFLPLRIRG